MPPVTAGNMAPVIRRLAPIVVLLLTLSACAGASRVAIDAGEDSLTRQELITVSNTLNGVTGESPPATVLARELRDDGTTYLRSLAYLDFFETQPGGIPDDLEAAMSDIITDATNAGQIPPLIFESREREAILTILMADALLTESPIGSLSASADAQFPDSLPILEEFTGNYSVESRLGMWDDEIFAIVVG